MISEALQVLAVKILAILHEAILSNLFLYLVNAPTPEGNSKQLKRKQNILTEARKHIFQFLIQA